MSILSRVSDYLVLRSMRTPYWHLGGYMLRYWLVPYRKDDKTGTTGLVSWTRRPIARLLQALDIAVRIHVILRSDNDRHPHSHPWNYVSVVLRGGYFEHTYDEQGKPINSKWYGPGSVLYRRASSLHRLWLPDGESATTLFITGRWLQVWGFMTSDGLIKHSDYSAWRADRKDKPTNPTEYA